MKKCIITMVASESEAFGYNADKIFKLNLANGDELIIPVLEAEAETPEKLKKEIDKMVNKLIEGLKEEALNNG